MLVLKACTRHVASYTDKTIFFLKTVMERKCSKGCHMRLKLKVTLALVFVYVYFNMIFIWWYAPTANHVNLGLYVTHNGLVLE